MTTERGRGRFEKWWDAHPLTTKFYVPAVATATLAVTVLTALLGGAR